MRKVLILFLLLCTNVSFSSGNDAPPVFDIIAYDFINSDSFKSNQYKLHYSFPNGGTYLDIFVSKNKYEWKVDYVKGVSYCGNCVPSKRYTKCKLPLKMKFEDAKNYIESDSFIPDLFPDKLDKKPKSKCKNYYSE